MGLDRATWGSRRRSGSCLAFTSWHTVSAAVAGQPNAGRWHVYRLFTCFCYLFLFLYFFILLFFFFYFFFLFFYGGGFRDPTGRALASAAGSGLGRRAGP